MAALCASISVATVAGADPPPSSLRAGNVLSIDPSIAHEGDPVTIVAPGCDQQLHVVISDSKGVGLFDQVEPVGSSRAVFTVPPGTAGTTLSVAASCEAPDGTTPFTYPLGAISVVRAGADATISADPTSLAGGGTTAISGTGCLFDGAAGVVDLFALDQSFSLPAAADGTWSVVVQAPPGFDPGDAPVNARCRGFGSTSSFEYADLVLTVRSTGLTGQGGGIAGHGNPVPAAPGPVAPTVPASRPASNPPAVGWAPSAPAPSNEPAPAAAPAEPVEDVATYVG